MVRLHQEDHKAYTHEKKPHHPDTTALEYDPFQAKSDSFHLNRENIAVSVQDVGVVMTYFKIDNFIEFLKCFIGFSIEAYNLIRILEASLFSVRGGNADHGGAKFLDGNPADIR